MSTTKATVKIAEEAEQALEKSSFSRAVELVISAVGLYASFLTWGYMQEKITGSPYVSPDGSSQGRWEFSYVLNICMTGVGSVLGFIAFTLEKQLRPAVRQNAHRLPSPFTYLKPALSNTLASPIGYHALKFINFPMMLLAKSCKLVPVMFMGWALNGETYSRAELSAVSLISLGVALFTIKPKDLVGLGLQGVAAKFMAPEKLQEVLSAGGGGDDDGDSLTFRLIGLALVSTNLLFDGYTNSAQKSINDRFKTKEYGSPSPFYTMLMMNTWSVALMASWLGLDWGLSALLPGQWRTSELTRAVAFLSAYPQVWVDLALFCLANAVGQLFIFYIIRAFNPVILVTLTVTRKFFSILISIVRFGHAVYPWQGFGMVILFSGLILTESAGRNKKKKAD
eukprot:CAMPEP_0171718630 /NCGR_PEP_ID=MMETSP0991-20121206/20722_1 /TAXON_ID=483369 /ORGANISM="non described non described, Strain CCMP2098" /LENGTH=395 /DNA_ID=CAMNT_0012310033 /DNA_START=64 /DNA_END=1251 /DNA_ORIENTATION=+